MDEHEVKNAEQAVFFMANDVVNEYHGFPVVCRNDIGGPNIMYIQLNGNWYEFRAQKVYGRKKIEELEELS